MFHYLTRQEADPDDVRVHRLRLLDADTEYLTIPQPVGGLGQLVDHAQRLLRHQHVVHVILLS